MCYRDMIHKNYCFRSDNIRMSQKNICKNSASFRNLNFFHTLRNCLIWIMSLQKQYFLNIILRLHIVFMECHRIPHCFKASFCYPKKITYWIERILKSFRTRDKHLRREFHRSYLNIMPSTIFPMFD